MRMGTKSLLFGYHQLLLHPLFVWAGWLKLFGWTWDPRVVLAFFVHDIGYWGKPNMDGLEGKQHPFLGAKIMHFLFDKPGLAEWHHFSLYHSRSMARTYLAEPSRLCFADKVAFYLYPKWLIRLLFSLSGEGLEYRQTSTDDSTTRLPKPISFEQWYAEATSKNLDFVMKDFKK